MISIIEDLPETMVMIQVLIDQIDDFYSVNSTYIKDVRPDSTKFVLGKVLKLLRVLHYGDEEDGTDD